MAMSRQSTYTEWHGEMICLGLSEGHSLLSICEALGVPYATAMRWEVDIPEHSVNAARAREFGCHALAEQALAIANTPHMGIVRTTKADGGIEERAEDMTAHRRLQIDTRKWLIAKWLPTVYGEKQQIEHSGGISVAEVLREAKAKRKGET
jgi:hypothetical protein